MALTATLEKAQHNFYQLLNQLDAGEIDKVNIQDEDARVAVLVTWAIYAAADAIGSAGVTPDLVATYSNSPAVQGSPLYRLTKRMRDGAAKSVAQIAAGAITAAAGADTVDAETFTITNAAGVTKTFEFDDDSSVTPGNVAVTFVGTENAGAMAALIRAAINGVVGFNVVAAAPAGAVVSLTQSAAGPQGNTTISDTVAHASFKVAGFSGGAYPYALGLKMSKNDSAYRAALIPDIYATAIGL